MILTRFERQSHPFRSLPRSPGQTGFRRGAMVEHVSDGPYKAAPVLGESAQGFRLPQSGTAAITNKLAFSAAIPGHPSISVTDNFQIFLTLRLYTYIQISCR